MKKAVLVGTDFMYRQDGSLVPIEINTNVGFDNDNRVETLEQMFDFAAFRTYLTGNGITTLYLEGSLMQLVNLQKVFTEKLGDIVSVNFTVDPSSIEESDTTLLVRTSYSETAILDGYAANKASFRKLIRNLSFGTEYIHDNEGQITSCPDNGNYPNFIVKSVTPHYDKGTYPKLYRFTSVADVQSLAASLSSQLLVEPYDYNEKSTCECLGKARIRLFRNWSVVISEDAALNSISIANYEKVSSKELLADTEITYQETGEVDSEYRSEFLVGTLNLQNFDVFAEDTDEIQLADGTWKSVADIAVNDQVMSIIIPTSGTVDPRSHEEDYNISYSEFVSGSQFTSASVGYFQSGETIIDRYSVEFTDGSTWADQGSSSYPTIDPEDGTVRFRELQKLEVGDTIILIESSTGNFVQKTIQTISSERKLVKGYTLSVDYPHTVVLRSSGETSEYFSIEHNLAVTCTNGTQCTCSNKLPVVSSAVVQYQHTVEITNSSSARWTISTLSFVSSIDGCEFKLSAPFTLSAGGGSQRLVTYLAYDPYHTTSVYVFTITGTQAGTSAQDSFLLDVLEGDIQAEFSTEEGLAYGWNTGMYDMYNWRTLYPIEIQDN